MFVLNAEHECIHPNFLFLIVAGIGSIPDCVLSKLTEHRDLGIHTEMFSDGIIDLVECGAVTNARKVIQTGKIVGGFALGTNRLYRFMNNNPLVGESLLSLLLSPVSSVLLFSLVLHSAPLYFLSSCCSTPLFLSSL